MARRRARTEPDSPERLALAVAWHRQALARLDARRAGLPVPPAPPAPPEPRPSPPCAAASTTPEQTYRATARLLGETSDDL